MKTLHTLQPSYYCTCHVCTYMYRIKYKLRRKSDLWLCGRRKTRPLINLNFYDGTEGTRQVTTITIPLRSIPISIILVVQGARFKVVQPFHICRNLMRPVLVDRKKNTKNVVDPKDCLQKNLVIYHRRGRT